MRIVILLIIFFCCNTLQAQKQEEINEGIMCYTKQITLKEYLERQQIMNQFQSENINVKKVVRVNFHYMLRSDGTGNFTPTDDNQGNSYNGYQNAQDIVNWMNGNMSWNQQMNIPPNNSTPVISKNIRFVLDAVYFHYDDNYFNFWSAGSNYNTIQQDIDSVMNVFLTHDPNASPNNPDPGGYASSLSFNSSVKYTENKDYYLRYLVWLNSQGTANPEPFSWTLHATGVNTAHELCHLLGLSHTVRYNNAPPCPTLAFGGNVNFNCDDGCGDTPTAWHITDDLNSGRHPACGWGNGGQMWCSNNLMDYSGATALTPCQIGIMHSGLSTGLDDYKACSATYDDRILTTLGHPKRSHFGKKVTIRPKNSIVPNLKSTERNEIYFSEEVIVKEIIIEDNADFEIIVQPTCN